MRRNPDMFQGGLQRWLRGGRGLEAEAAGLNLAELFILAGDYMTDGAFSKS
jgi:hypothetical protein